MESRSNEQCFLHRIAGFLVVEFHLDRRVLCAEIVNTNLEPWHDGSYPDMPQIELNATGMVHSRSCPRLRGRALRIGYRRS